METVAFRGCYPYNYGGNGGLGGGGAGGGGGWVSDISGWDIDLPNFCDPCVQAILKGG